MAEGHEKRGKSTKGHNATYRDPYTKPVTGWTGTREKSARRPSRTEVGASKGKLGNTTYGAHAAYTDPYTDP